MNKLITSMILLSPLTMAAHIYSEPSEKSNIVSDIEPSHEYSLKTQDWVAVVDRTTNQKGWAKLSDLKDALSENSQWSYQWHQTSHGSQQTMHYKPFSLEDVNKHLKQVHQQHKKIMRSFDNFWEELESSFEADQTDQA